LTQEANFIHFVYTVLATIGVIGILIFIHEFGHFIVAKWMGVRVEIFSLGFGPKIFGIKGGETEYRLSLVPLGGYVKLYGENPEEAPNLPDKDRTFYYKKVWQKALIVLAGPLMNFVFPVLVFWILFSTTGVYVIPPKVGKVLPNTPAQKAGLKPGDEILAINGKRVHSFESLVLYLREHTELKEVTLKIKRDGKIFTVVIHPAYREGYNIFRKKTKIPYIGITAKPTFIHKKYGVVKAFVLAVKKVWDITYLTLVAVVKLVLGELPFSTLGGPITIGKMIGQNVQYGLLPLLSFTAFLSINLGIINLLPIPMLDGGHLVIYLVEAIRGRPISLKTLELILKIGIVILIALMIAVFYNDIIKLLSGWKHP